MTVNGIEGIIQQADHNSDFAQFIVEELTKRFGIACWPPLSLAEILQFYLKEIASGDPKAFSLPEVGPFDYFH